MLKPSRLLIMLVSAAIVYLAVCIVFSNIMLYSHRQPIVRTPQDYGIGYEDIVFKSTDGITLKGWLLPAESDKIIIMTHAFPFNRHGFIAKNQGWITRINKDVDLLKTADVLHRNGWGVLMFDFRNHGESGKGITGMGLSEYQDVAGAVDYIRSRPDLKNKQIGLVSFCMGANAAIVALSKAKEKLKDVKFLVAIQPVSVEVFLPRYAKSAYTPLALLTIPLVEKICIWRGGYPFKEMSPLKFCRDIEIPVLYVQAKKDFLTDLSDIEGFYDATAGPKELWWIEEVADRFDAYNYVGTHPDKILAFIKKYF
jgi:fermentation-respiration switch protein FrsA (DUF1100 family)